jgi:hypothetical protein
MDLEDLSVDGGRSGRASAKYTITYRGAKPTTGRMTWIVISDKGRPRISLIAFRPD